MIKLLPCDHAGVGQVIKGWDVGVNGRHINDQELTCMFNLLSVYLHVYLC